MSADDKRLIEDYLPIEKISEEASREKSVRKGHISTLHLWWARRPLVACRAAVYGTLVPADRFKPANGPEEKRASLARANAAKFVERLCKYPGDPNTIAEAQRHILEAHADRLSKETGVPVSAEDILAGRAPRPKVLDLFAGGGAIPLETLRLGCDAYAVDLNPVAHIIELCTLVYPQKYGEPDRNVKGCSKDGTWAGLAQEVRYWGSSVLESVRAEIGDLYPPISEPDASRVRQALGRAQLEIPGEDFDLGRQRTLREETPTACLLPVAYVWTRTVTCKNPNCKAMVPLVRQTWLSKKESRNVAVKIVTAKGKKRVRFELVRSNDEKGLCFDPAAFSKGGSATCAFCGAVADIDYIKSEGCSRRIGHQMMAVVCEKGEGKTKRYVEPPESWEGSLDDSVLSKRAEEIAGKFDLTIPDERLEANPRSFDVQHFGFLRWRDIFSARQLVAMLAFTGSIRAAYTDINQRGYAEERGEAIATCLSMVLGRLADYCTSFCTWQPEFIKNTFNSPGLPMVMDYAESNPLEDSSGSWPSALRYVESAIMSSISVPIPAKVVRGSALSVPFGDEEFDAIVTDPPYYDSRSYSNLADHFYVWHKRAVGHLYPEHFAYELTPKKIEVIAAPYRHGGVRDDADTFYERMMQEAFSEARRLLKPGSPMVCVYAHKTTAGWTTLINSLKSAGFTVIEAWPVEMERRSRQNAQETSALTSSIFLVTRRRESLEKGRYEDEVRPELERIVRERVQTLWEMGISGADLVISCVGAGLRAFTRYANVEFVNGEEVPAERFLAEVETTVLETILARLSKEVSTNGGRYGLAGVDPATRFYILWRYTYKNKELDSGEAIIFANGTHVELDGPTGLSYGARALVAKQRGKYKLREFSERGDNEKLGIPTGDGRPVPIIDILHRTLWLMEHHTSGLPELFRESQPNREQLRLVAQALAGPALRGGELDQVSPGSELAAIAKLTANWQSVVEDAAVAPTEREDRRTGQRPLAFEKERRR